MNEELDDILTEIQSFQMLMPYKKRIYNPHYQQLFREADKIIYDEQSICNSL
jgi:hypothetical protein